MAPSTTDTKRQNSTIQTPGIIQDVAGASDISSHRNSISRDALTKVWPTITHNLIVTGL